MVRTSRDDAGKKQVEVNLTQTQATAAYRLNVDVGITTAPGALATIERVEMTAKTAMLVFEAATEPGSVTIDPSTWMLIEMGPFARAK